MQTRIFLVRHTETIGNVEKRLMGHVDYDITLRGWELISKLTEELKEIKFDAIYSSLSGRAIKTVEPLANINGIKVQRDKGLMEIYFGIYDGFRWEDVNKIDPDIRKRKDDINEISGIPEQESMADVSNRVYSTILKIAKMNEGKHVLIVSHGVAIEAFLRKITGVPFECEREKYRQYNVAINELEFENNEFRIIDIGNIKYLK